MSFSTHFQECMSVTERIAAIERAVTSQPAGAARWAMLHDKLSPETLELVAAVKVSVCDPAVSPRQHNKVDRRLHRRLDHVCEDEAQAGHEIMVVFAMCLEAVFASA